MQARFREIVAKRGIKVIVETGIDKGLSTVKLAGMAGTVFAVDNNVHCFRELYENLGRAGVKNVVPVLASSPDALHALRPLLPDETLFFLDAHWQSYWPLLDEIAAIRPGAGVIVMHDVVVPGHPELGSDCYGGQHLNYEYVKEALTRWSPTHRIEYNERADCPMPRGVGYVFPR